MLKKMHRPFYRPHNVSVWEKVFLGHTASRDVAIAWFGQYKNWLRSLVLLLGPFDEYKQLPCFLCFLTCELDKR